MIKDLQRNHDVTYSVIVLGDREIDLPEANYIISIPHAELSDPQAIAEMISGHINKLVLDKRRQRRHVA